LGLSEARYFMGINVFIYKRWASEARYFMGLNVFIYYKRWAFSEARYFMGLNVFIYYKRWAFSEARYFMGWLTNISKNLLTQRSAVWAGIYPFFYEFKLRPRRGPTFVATIIPHNMPGLGEAQRL